MITECALIFREFPSQNPPFGFGQTHNIALGPNKKYRLYQTLQIVLLSLYEYPITLALIFHR